MKKRILPFIVAMSVVLPIQSFAAESAEASTKIDNEGQWKVVWQSSNPIFKYKVVKLKPKKYKFPLFGHKDYPVIKPKPEAVQPKPEAVQPKPEAVQPKPEAVQPKPEAVQPKPEAVQPKPEAVQPKPEAVQPKPEAVQPKPEAVQPKPEAVQPKPEAVQPKPDVEQKPVVPNDEVVDTSILAVEQEVVRLVNVERAKEGLQPLTMDVELQKVAKKKSEDMKAKNYFSHTSPTYGSPFDMMKQFGISYKAAGENIAKGQTSAKQVVDAWMNSAGHRANIMSTSFTHIGVGYLESGHYWTQMFIKK